MTTLGNSVIPAYYTERRPEETFGPARSNLR
jgi:hypothetical protein